MINVNSILKNIGAGSLTVFINIVFQLLSVPIFLKFWGVNLYGEWIVFTSITAYFSITDIGLSTVTSNDFSINYAREKYKKCNILLNNNIFFIVFIFTLIFITLFIICSFVNLSKVLNFTILSENEVEFGMLLLIIQVFLGMLSNLLNSIYRAIHSFARGMMIDNIIRIMENLVLISGVILKISFVNLLFLYILPRLIGLFFKYIDSKRYYNLKINIKYFDKGEFKKIIIPSLSFFSFPVGNSIILQGFTLLVSFLMGTTAVVVFNTTRTLVNFIKTGLSLVANSVWPEFSLAYGIDDKISMKKMFRSTVSISLYLSFILSLFLLVFGKMIYIFWTNEKIDLDYTLLVTFVITIITNTIWYSASIALAATNNHKTYSLYYLVSSALSLIIGYIMLRLFQDLSYLPLSLLIIDCFLIGIVLKQSFTIVDDNFKDFFHSIFTEPIDFIRVKLNLAQ